MPPRTFIDHFDTSVFINKGVVWPPLLVKQFPRVVAFADTPLTKFWPTHSHFVVQAGLKCEKEKKNSQFRKQLQGLLLVGF